MDVFFISFQILFFFFNTVPLFSHFCRLLYFFFDLKFFFFIVQPIKTKNTVGGQGGGLFKFDAIQLIFLLAKLKKQWFAIIFFSIQSSLFFCFPSPKHTMTCHNDNNDDNYEGDKKKQIYRYRIFFFLLPVTKQKRPPMIFSVLSFSLIWTSFSQLFYFH